MASPSFDTLVTAQTRQQILADWLTQLANGKQPFPVTAWPAGSTFPTLMGLGAGSIADADVKAVNLAKGAYSQTAFGGWVDLLIGQRGLVRGTAQATVGPMTVTPASGVVGSTVNPFALTVTDGSGHEFTNNTGGTLTSGANVFTFTATSPGAAWNIASGQTLPVVTGPPGLTVTNPGGGGFWFTLPGTDPEGDDSCLVRYVNVLPALSTGSPAGAIQNWCFAASNDVRAVFSQALGNGAVQLVVFSQNGPVSLGGLAAVKAYVAARLPSVARIADGTPRNAQAWPLLMRAVLYGPASANATGQAVAAAQAGLGTLLQNTPIGGYAISSGTPGLRGIGQSTLMQAIADAVPAVSRIDLLVSNDSGSTYQSATGVVTSGGIQSGGTQTNFLMPPQAGVPVVATQPGGANPFTLSFTSTG